MSVYFLKYINKINNCYEKSLRKLQVMYMHALRAIGYVLLTLISFFLK